MTELNGRAETAHAVLYMNKMAKHFRHKVPVQLEEGWAVIEFEAGRCALSADAARLNARIEAASPEAAEVVREVIDRHLPRFAPKEALTINWQLAD